MPYFARCAHEMLIKIFMLYCFMQMLNENNKSNIKVNLIFVKDKLNKRGGDAIGRESQAFF